MEEKKTDRKDRGKHVALCRTPRLLIGRVLRRLQLADGAQR